MRAAAILMGWALLSIAVGVLLGKAIAAMGADRGADIDTDDSTTPPPTDTLQQRMQQSAQHPALAQAQAGVAMPWWAWAVAPIVFVGAVAASAAWPWGFAP